MNLDNAVHDRSIDSTSAPRILGLDIGGANLKAATADGTAKSVSFPLWQKPEELPAAICSLIATFPETSEIAVTMTGELADCYRTKREGVEHITQAIVTATAGKHVRLWGTDGRWHGPDSVGENWPVIAAANWHLQATALAKWMRLDNAVLMDVGSTTTDIIPICGRRVAARGMTDVTRLAAGELIYQGIRRTPFVAVLPVASITIDGQPQSVPASAELFATTYDLSLLAGYLPEDETCHETANGRPATQGEARSRIVRQWCCDETEISAAEVESLVRQGIAVLQQRIMESLNRVIQGMKTVPAVILVTGEGERLGLDALVQSSGLRDVSARTVPGLGRDARVASAAWAAAWLAGQDSSPGGFAIPASTIYDTGDSPPENPR